MNLFGNKKKSKQAKKSKSGSSGGNGLSFTRVQVVSKPEIVGKLLKGVKEQTVETDVARQKLKAASLVSGRGRGTFYNYTMHPFKTGPRPVAILSSPRSTAGGNFVPADNPMETGEVIEFTFEMPLAEAGGSNLYFQGKGPYIQTALYIPNAKDPSKPWVGSRELTEKKMGANAVKQGEEVLQVRVDQLTVFPNAPETFTGDQFAPYIFSPSLYVICGGGVWTKRGGSGYFEEIPDTLEKHLEKQEQIKEIKPVTLAEFGVDTVAMVASEDLFTDFEHDRLVPSVKKKPNDNLQVLNSIMGFLLRIELSDDIKELMMRTYPQKIGKEVEVWLPLTLGQVTDMEPPKRRLLFQIFPRDLTQETNPQRRKSHPGIKFVPPFTLHPNAEDQNTYRKLMVTIGQRMKDDARPEEDRNKLASVQAQVAQRQQETKGKRVDENLRKAFQKRQEAKKRKDEA